MKKLLTIVLLFAGLCGAATITPYTDEGLWNYAVAAVADYQYTENFDDTVFEPWLTITSDQPGGVVGFQWESIVDSNPVKRDTFAFSAPNVIAFCATFNLSFPGGAGEGIDVFADLTTAGGYTQAYQLPGSHSGFVGFIVTGDKFTSVQLRGAGGAGVQETYWMDDLSIAGQVPEPTTLYLMIGPALLLAGRLIRRRR